MAYRLVAHILLLFLITRGVSFSKKIPFRKWYGCLGEVTSALPKNCSTMVLTATATKSSINQILQTLSLSSNDVVFIQGSPDRPNLHFSKKLLDNNDPLEIVNYRCYRQSRQA